MAASESPSMSSNAAGTTRRRMTSDTASTAPRMPSNVASMVAFACGFGTRRTVIFVMIASVPSEPTSSCVEVVADDILDGLGAGVDDLARRQHRFERKDVALRRAVAERARPAGAFRNVAADG